MSSKTHEYAWAAGFFDGEGCIRLRRQRHRRKSGEVKIYFYADLQMTSTDLCLLERFQRVFDGRGRIVPNDVDPEKYPGRRSRWHYGVTRRSDIEFIIKKMRPWLSLPKLSDAEDALRPRDAVVEIP